ncbi:hypothetical protein [Nocardia vaccinii]|uniref:hypothetical protein n=1 Tax=Nocardia vaccinii TaxID=1822 RepID=UPI00083700FC|nr:hypothetical protein [Nocardia vaccinii]
MAVTLGIGIGIGIGTGVGVGIGIGTGVGVGVGTGMGVDVGTGAGVGVDVGMGRGADVGTGAGASVGTNIGLGGGMGMGADMGIGGTVSSPVLIGRSTGGAGIVARLRDHGVGSGAESAARCCGVSGCSGIGVDVAVNACAAPSVVYMSADAMAAFNSSTVRDAWPMSSSNVATNARNASVSNRDG